MCDDEQNQLVASASDVAWKIATGEAVDEKVVSSSSSEVAYSGEDVDREGNEGMENKQ